MMPWYNYLVEFLAGLVLCNGVPHFVQGVSGAPFQSPFASPRGIGETSPLSNAIWGFANFVAGFLLLWFFPPQGFEALAGWLAVGLGVLLTAMWSSRHFGAVRAARR
jgi:hypothetical protein